MQEATGRVLNNTNRESMEERIGDGDGVKKYLNLV